MGIKYPERAHMQSTLQERLILNGYNPPSAIKSITNWIPHMSIPHRKVFLTTCQIGIPNLYRAKPDPSISIFRTQPVTRGKATLSIQEYSNMEVATAETVVNRSIIMALLKTEVYLVDPGNEEVREEVLLKEVTAAMSKFAEEQVLNYGQLFTGMDHGLTPETPITPSWRTTCFRIAKRIEKRLSSLGTIFPQYQRHKNCSRSTARGLQAIGYGLDRKEGDLSTLDLEICWYEKGYKVEGATELRVAWRYNDLKPRPYYCIGGSNYWVSRYMRRIAVELMECNDISAQRTRNNPSLLNPGISSTDSIAIWDYSAFTSTLSELKFFIYWLSRYLESSQYMRNEYLALFDFRLGIVHRRIWEVLDEYNDQVNLYSEVDLYRVIDDELKEEGLASSFKMANSGGLGTAGNIGLSTALHGIHIAGMTQDEEKGCGVGDDALAVTNMDQEDVHNHLSLIGVVNMEKMGWMEPMIGFGSRDEFVEKFLKRGLHRNHDGIWLDELLVLPVMNYVLDCVDTFHTHYERPSKERVQAFVNGVGSLLWEINRLSDRVTEHACEHLLGLLRAAYRFVGLPAVGALPGKCARVSENQMIPPLNYPFDPRTSDWAVYLYTYFEGTRFELPMTMDHAVMHEPFHRVGQQFEATSSQLLVALEDIGVLKKLKSKRIVITANTDNRRYFKKFLARDGQILHLYEYQKVPRSELIDTISMFAHDLRSDEVSMYQNVLHMF